MQISTCNTDVRFLYKKRTSKMNNHMHTEVQEDIRLTVYGSKIEIKITQSM